MFKKALLPLILIIISVFLSLLFAEFLIRLIPTLEVRYDFKKYYEPDNKPGPPGPYRPSSIIELGYEIIPNAAWFINRYGMIGKAHNLQKDKSCFRIIVIGDSITERHWYVEKLEELLNANQNLEYRFELWNAGVGGYNIDQYYYYLKYRLLKYQPDMVIIGLGMNDFDTSMVVCYKDTEKGLVKYRFPLRGYGSIKPNPFLFKHSYLYRLLLVKIGEIGNFRKKGNKNKEEGKYYLMRIKDICEKHKIPLLCLVFTYLKPFNECNSGEKQNARIILYTLDELKIDYIDLAPFFPEDKRYSLRVEENKEDYVHPNEEGHRIIAEAMYSYICNNYFKVSR